MIKANELRVGNYVMPDIGEKPIMVDDVVIEIVGDFESNFYEGVPLTPEIAEKCGFKLNSKGAFDYYYKYFKQTDTKGCEQLSKFSLGRNCTEVFINDRWICGIASLHKLQNLYYAITNEELEITL